ncbi:MAG TPA: MgtC/SapB family protein [Gemmatimonadales bacterium]|nr:MgtC/SapB family protein [Gemmatimonadales bacterium]
MHPDFDILGRVLVAGLLAGVLGWEREHAGKSAGLRTHMLVGIAAALYTGLAELASAEIGAGHSDPVRVVQAVAMGIGFLGGGMIFVNRSGDRVQGLTTAASIWATAAMGMAAGLAHFRLAVGVTVLLAVVLHVLARFDKSEH